MYLLPYLNRLILFPDFLWLYYSQILLFFFIWICFLDLPFHRVCQIFVLFFNMFFRSFLSLSSFSSCFPKSFFFIWICLTDLTFHPVFQNLVFFYLNMSSKSFFSLSSFSSCFPNLSSLLFYLNMSSRSFFSLSSSLSYLSIPDQFWWTLSFPYLHLFLIYLFLDQF